MRVGNYYSARSESLKLSLLLSCVCLVLLYSDALWRWDRLIYDVQASLITHQADDDIVIIAVDESSLNALGRWPWPRGTHAKLINKLTEYQVKAILVDVIFSEPSADNKQDQYLAEAIEKNGKVVLPVLLEQTRLRGQLLETLPLPTLTQAAAELGHVHVELDPDGIARGTYLFEGLGEAHWPHIGLSTLAILNEPHARQYLTNRQINNSIESPWTWVRQQAFLIPFIGPPGSFKTTSYINVLNNEQMATTLKDKIVLIGVTAAGLGDALPTPVSGLARAMPGIEINANIIQAIRSNKLINPLNTSLHYLSAALLVFLTVLSFLFLTPRMTLLIVLVESALIFAISLFSLHVFQIWIPISTLLVCILLAYPLWAWRRLEFTLSYLNRSLVTLSTEANEIQHFVAEDIKLPFESLQNLLPIDGIKVFNSSGSILLADGKACDECTASILSSEWYAITPRLYTREVTLNHNAYTICVNWKNEDFPNDLQLKTLKSYIRQSIKAIQPKIRSTAEAIESRIEEIQETTDKLSALRNFITDSLEQMADGVVVIDSLGTITLINQQACQLLNNTQPEDLLHQPIQVLFESMTVSSGETWASVSESLLIEKQYENLQVKTQRGKDLVIHIRPLLNASQAISGFIINLSDISIIKDTQRKRDEMLSFLSHDLRSPLVSVLALLQSSETHQADMNSRIAHNINHTIKLAEDFVHLSRIESDEKLSFQSINMIDVIANATDTVWDQAKNNAITITQQLPDEAWLVGNASILERVMINLLSNAIKYGGHGCEIIIKLTIHDAIISCCVNDNGPGIAQEQLPYLFDRFKRINPESNSISGIGLGLAFVNAAIEKHQGRIDVSSEQDMGTTFCLHLPAEKITEPT